MVASSDLTRIHSFWQHKSRLTTSCDFNPASFLLTPQVKTTENTKLFILAQHGKKAFIAYCVQTQYPVQSTHLRDVEMVIAE